jgi:hypothetical protein
MTTLNWIDTVIAQVGRAGTAVATLLDSNTFTPPGGEVTFAFAPVGDEVNVEVLANTAKDYDSPLAAQVEAAAWAEELVRQELGLPLSTGFVELEAECLESMEPRQNLKVDARTAWIFGFSRKPVATTIAQIKTAAKRAAELEVGRVYPQSFPERDRRKNPLGSANAEAMKLRRKLGLPRKVQLVGKSEVAKGWAQAHPGEYALMVDDNVAAMAGQRGRQ